MYPIGEADQATAAGILAKIDKGFIERLSVLSKKDRMLVLSLIKYTAKSKWILPK